MEFQKNQTTNQTTKTTKQPTKEERRYIVNGIVFGHKGRWGPGNASVDTNESCKTWI